MALEEREAIKDPRMLVQGLVVLALVVVGFVLHPVPHYEPGVVALLGAGLLIAVSAVETGEVLGEVEWPTLAFFAGLFIMIGGLIETGVIGEVSKSLADAIGDNELGGSMLLSASAVLSGIVDNIPSDPPLHAPDGRDRRPASGLAGQRRLTPPAATAGRRQRARRPQPSPRPRWPASTHLELRPR